MKLRSILEITTNSYIEQQYILSKFPQARWLTLDESLTKFYVPYELYSEVKTAIQEWEKNNG
jgi:hypothetical protein